MKNVISISIETNEEETGERMEDLHEWCVNHKLPYYMTVEKSEEEKKDDVD